MVAGSETGSANNDGRLMAEVQIIAVDRVQARRIGSADHPGLRRNELTPYTKRLQLAAVGVRGVEADAIVEQLYGPQT